MTHSFAGLINIINPASKHAAQAIKLFKDVFDNENRLRKLFDEGKISETEFLERRVNDVKPYMDNLHSWLLEKNQAERSVKSWGMARRNFLFSGSGNGARASCFIKGLLQTLKTAKSRL